MAASFLLQLRNGLHEPFLASFPKDAENEAFVTINLRGVKDTAETTLFFFTVADIERLVTALGNAKLRLMALTADYPFRKCAGIHPPYSGKCEHCQPPSPEPDYPLTEEPDDAVVPLDVPSSLPATDKIGPKTCEADGCDSIPDKDHLYCPACLAELEKEIAF